MNMFPYYKNVYKALNISSKEELHKFILEHNNNHLPHVGGGLNEECGSDHYGYEIMFTSTDLSIIGAREIYGCDCIFWAVLCTDKRQKKNYGKYIKAVPNYNNKLIPIKKANKYWISEEIRLTELDPSF